MIFNIVKTRNLYVLSCLAFSLVPVMAWITSVLLKRKKHIIQDNNGKILLIPLIVITGCDTGLGYSIVMRYLNDGHCNENYNKIFSLLMFNNKNIIVPKKIAIVAFCLNPKGFGPNCLIKQSLKNSKVKLFVRQLDLTDSDSIKKGVTFIVDLLEQNIDENGTPYENGTPNDTSCCFKYELHALVNNAARMVMAEFEWQTPQMINKQFEVNVLGPIMLTVELLPTFRKHKSRVINVISNCAHLPLPGVSIYGSTKAALNAWTRGSRVELETHGVRMITFLPGSFYLYSSIMNGEQRTHDFNLMREHMNSEQLAYYGSYLDKYQNYLSSIDAYISHPGKTIPSGNKIYSQMDNALWALKPKAEYNVPEPWRYKRYFILTWILASFGLHGFKDEVIRWFVATPRFKKN